METILLRILRKVDPEIQIHITAFPNKPRAGLFQAKQLLAKAKADSIVASKIMEELEHTMISEAENSTAEKITDRRQRNSKMHQLYVQLRKRFKAQHSGGLPNILIQSDANDPTSPVRVVTDPTEVEQLLIKRNIKHFGQSQGTPFTTAPIIEHLGYRGNSPQVTKIINGENITHISDNTSPSVQAILSHLNNGL